MKNITIKTTILFRAIDFLVTMKDFLFLETMSDFLYLTMIRKKNMIIKIDSI